jgi:hypothetical protein
MPGIPIQTGIAVLLLTATPRLAMACRGRRAADDFSTSALARPRRPWTWGR